MRVLLVDDHRLLVEGLSNLLAAHGFEVVGTPGNGLEAVAQARALQPDLILMDLRMAPCDGLTATRLIKAEMPGIQIVILTTSAEDQDLFEAIKCGACGYLLKSMAGNEFIEALHGLEQGYPPFSPGLAAKIMAEFVRQAGGETQMPAQHGDEAPRNEAPQIGADGGLTARQSEILALVAQGLSYKEVAARVGLSVNTVKYHMGETIQHLHLQNRAQALAYAVRSGLVKPE
jgi:DNA-binding NarL/FixJ family response regulator